MNRPERGISESDSLNKDITALSNLKKRRSEKLELTSTASSRLVSVIGIKCGELKFKLRLGSPVLLLLLKACLPPLLSGAVDDAFTHDLHILAFVYEDAGVHAPALNSFPSGEYRRIEREIRDEYKLCILFDHKTAMRRDRKRR